MRCRPSISSQACHYCLQAEPGIQLGVLFMLA